VPDPADLSASPAAVERILREHHRRHPCLTRLVALGQSHLGRPLWALAIGRSLPDGRGRSTLLLDGAHHGDEPLAASFVLDAARYLLARAGRDRQVDRWLDELVIWCVPLVNPDGVQTYLDRTLAHTGVKSPGRKNGRDNDGNGRFGPNDGVDLNRNYPFKWGFLGEAGSTGAYALRSYRGPAAASEPETQAMVRLAESEVFAASISYHIGGVALLVPYTIDRVRSPEPNEAWPIAEQLAREMPLHPDAVAAGGFPVRRNLYSVDGTDQDWHRHAHGTVAFLIESALRGADATAEGRAERVRAMRGSWSLLADRYLDGPSIEGQVLDAAGRPVAAEVHLAEVRLHEGESWRARCHDGHFARFVAQAAGYTLRVRVDGHDQVVEQRVVVSAAAGRARVTVRLPFAVKPASCPALPPDAE
jgi:hypothetical protein